MKLSHLLTEDAILAEMGQRMAHRRLDLQLTQAEVARQAGVAKRTLERIEAGSSAQLSSLIRIFRVLDLLSTLDRVIPEAQVGPMALLKRQGKQRQRASNRRGSQRTHKPWSWDDKA